MAKMKRLSLFIFLFFSTAVGFATDLQLESRVVEHTYPNGIHLLVLERHFSPTVSIRMNFRTGSVDEIEGKTGLAHMFEHMMFKGTRTQGTKNYAAEAPFLAKVDQLHRELDKEKAKGEKADQGLIGKLIEQLGDAEKKASQWVIPNELWNLYEREGASELNAWTAPDLTQYVVDLPSNKLQLWAIIDSDRVRNPVFRQFYSEREVVKEERRMRVDTNPDGRLYEHFLASAFIAHPYRHPTIGWESDLDHLTVEDLQDFYKRHYTPNRLTIAIVGDVKAPDVIALVDKYFGSWKPEVTPANETTTKEPLQTGQRRETVDFEAEPKILIGFHTPKYPDLDTFVLSAIAHLLSDGQSSRLYRSMVEKRKIAASVDADPSSPGERYEQLFVISSTPRFPHTTTEVETAIFQELEKIKKDLIEPWELEKIRSRVGMDLLGTLQTNDGMASTLVYDQAIFGDWHTLLKYQHAIDTMTAKDIQRVAQRIFKQENSTVATRLRSKKK
jgi:predicted Zn-dependent peptidase